MVVGSLEPNSIGNNEEDVEQIDSEPWKDESPVVLADTLHHQTREDKVQEVVEDHESSSSFHSCK